MFRSEEKFVQIEVTFLTEVMHANYSWSILFIKNWMQNLFVN